MYEKCSEQYWLDRRKVKPMEKWKRHILVTTIVSTVFVCGITLRLRSKRQLIRTQETRIQRQLEENQRKRKILLESLTRPTPNKDHFLKCETELKGSLFFQECNQLCNMERMSIPRPIMHEACLHGCSSSLTSSALLGCREASEDDVYRQLGSQVYAQCSRYQNTNPKPDVLSTCRKYHREGSKRGRILGSEKIREILDAEFAALRLHYEQMDTLEM